MRKESKFGNKNAIHSQLQTQAAYNAVTASCELSTQPRSERDANPAYIKCKMKYFHASQSSYRCSTEEPITSIFDRLPALRWYAVKYEQLYKIKRGYRRAIFRTWDTWGEIQIPLNAGLDANIPGRPHTKDALSHLNTDQHRKQVYFASNKI